MRSDPGQMMIEAHVRVLLGGDLTREDNTGSGGLVCGSDDVTGVTAIDLVPSFTRDAIQYEERSLTAYVFAF